MEHHPTIFQMFVSAFVVLSPVGSALGAEVEWYDGIHVVTYCVGSKTDPVVATALDMFASDMESVTGRKAVASPQREAAVSIVELDKSPARLRRRLREQGVAVDSLERMTDGFSISVVGRQLCVVGANGRGTAYGVLELSRMAGVSPWVWWGDVRPARRDRLVVDSSFSTLQGASVEYRGIFINDEDWSLRQWSSLTYDPRGGGTIGLNTYRRVFRLLMRLRANALWPGMHPGTTAFFDILGAKEAADSCGIAVGSSHCEPLLRNNVGEWDTARRGSYNYITNRQSVLDYWTERLRQVRGSRGGNLLTIGMRGLHDGSMEGVSTIGEKERALQQVIDDQQRLIGRYLGDPARQTQVFIPYKEVLQIYERGLRVPDYVTLMWCDDNYGYITRLSDKDEQRRSGGSGVYYHLSYWGQPHDYLWLATTQPGLVCSEMHTAYDHGARKIWIVNVHDPKVAGYGLELFLDMAWNIRSVSPSDVSDHYRRWLCRQFGEEAGRRLFPTMHEFYRLCGERKPEFMGWSQVERWETGVHGGYTPVADSELSLSAFGDELDRYLDRYADVCRTVRQTASAVRPELRDAYYAAIAYPVLAAGAQARKILEAQRARSLADGDCRPSTSAGRLRSVAEASARSLRAYQELRSLTAFYNDSLAGGKWRGLMDMKPRDLPVFYAPTVPVGLTDSEMSRMPSDGDAVSAHPVKASLAVAGNACDYEQASEGVQKVEMLGHSMNAVALPKDGSLTFEFTARKDGDCLLSVELIPTQPADNGDLRFSVSVDGAEPVVFNLKEPFRSERWKKRVLRGQAVESLKLKALKAGRHTFTVRAIDDHVIVDQWMADWNPARSFYLFPVK